MPRMTVEIRTDENGYFCKTVPFTPPGSLAATTRLTLTLLSPYATGLWGTVAIDARDFEPSNDRRAFVAWHSEVVQLGSWCLDGGDDIIVIAGKTKPTRVHARLVLEIDAAV